jgi:hypothetical protein
MKLIAKIPKMMTIILSGDMFIKLKIKNEKLKTITKN